MRWALLLLLALVALGPAGASGEGAAREARWNPRPVDVEVSPSQGDAKTRFRVKFTARNNALGRRYYGIEASGPELDGCDYDTARFRHARRGDRMRVLIPSKRIEPDWCQGHYDGAVFLLRRTRSGSFKDALVGRLSFEVR